MKDLSILSCFTNGCFFFFICFFIFLRISSLLRQKGEASETLHRATFESLHWQQFNLWPAHCQPLTRLRILSVLPSLTSLPLKSSHSHTRLCLKQVNTHTLTASRTLTPDWLWIPDKEPSLWISKGCLFEHVGMTHVLVLRGSNHPDVVGATGVICCSSMLQLILRWLLRFLLLEMFSDASFIDRKKTVWEL